MGTPNEGHQTEIAFPGMDEVPAVEGIQGLDKKILRMMGLQVKGQGFHVFRNKGRVMEDGVVDTLKDIRCSSIADFPGMVDKARAKRPDGTLVFR
jgi:hypothetical protein